MEYAVAAFHDTVYAALLDHSKTADEPLTSASTRAARLPSHLRLGITLPGMRELHAALPRDAVDQVNALIPKDMRKGVLKFPENKDVNGYVNQFFVTNEAKADGLGVCERLQAAGSRTSGLTLVLRSGFVERPLQPSPVANPQLGVLASCRCSCCELSNAMGGACVGEQVMAEG